MPLSVNNVNLTISDVKDITSGRLAVNFENSQGDLKNGAISMNGETFTVKFAHGLATVNKQYSGFFGRLKSFFFGGTREAQMIQDKMNDIIRDSNWTDFQIVSNSRANLDWMMRNWQGDGPLELAHYGIDDVRRTVERSGLVEALNEKYAAMGSNRRLSFRYAETCNEGLNLHPSSFAPKNLADTLEKIRSGSLPMKEGVFADDRDRENAAKWKAFLARPENLKNLDIPGKLNRLMNLPPEFMPTKKTGWEATFAKAPDKLEALRYFVLKNLPKDAHEISKVEVGQVSNRLEVYLKLCAMPDGEEKIRKMEDFLQPENWKEVAPGNRKRVHQFFCAVFENAAMRQLTKMSVRFFNEEKIPAFFQYADEFGRSLNFRRKGECKDWYGKNVAKEGRKHKIQDVRLHGGSPIAYTAIRYGVKAQAADEKKVIAELGEDYENKGIPIGKLPSHYYAFSDGFDEFVMPWQDEIRMNLNRNNV